MRAYSLILICIIASGCVGTAKTLSFDPVDASTVVVSNELPVGAVMIQRVAVEHCYDPFGPRTTNLEVLSALKEKAAGIGANRLRRVSYQRTGLMSTCFSSGGILASAVAYRVENVNDQ